MGHENTLFFGNGFSKTVFKGIPSWGDLFVGANSAIDNYTIRYEAYRLLRKNAEIDEATIKKGLIQAVNAPFSEDNLDKDICDLSSFGDFLKRCNVNNIITTNYDTGVEFVLERCGYCEQKNSDMTVERIYSIRTYKLFFNTASSHSVKVWKIHGDIDRIASITLGFDQYCGSLAKLTEYVKGTYKSSQSANGIKCDIPMKKKCQSGVFDNISWAELFFRTDVYIVGFGMDFSEIDIWWLLNKRARFQSEGILVNNSISYIYNSDYESEQTKPSIYAALEAFNVNKYSIKSCRHYFHEIFQIIMHNSGLPEMNEAKSRA